MQKLTWGRCFRQRNRLKREEQSSCITHFCAVSSSFELVLCLSLSYYLTYLATAFHLDFRIGKQKKKYTCMRLMVLTLNPCNLHDNIHHHYLYWSGVRHQFYTYFPAITLICTLWVMVPYLCLIINQDPYTHNLQFGCFIGF